MSIGRVVVDTSALVDSADNDRPEWGEAFRYLQGCYPFEAPHLVGSEAGNVVHGKRARAFGASAGERTDVLEALLDGVRTWTSDEHVRRRSGALAEERALSFYDAEFLELAARDEECVLLTQDQRLLDAARLELGPDRAFDLDEAARRIAAGTL